MDQHAGFFRQAGQQLVSAFHAFPQMISERIEEPFVILAQIYSKIKACK